MNSYELHTGVPQGSHGHTRRDPDESLRSMTPDSDSLLFWRVRVMTLEKLESQSHDSERVGDSAVFMGVVTLGEPDFRPFSLFSPKRPCYFRTADASTDAV